ncbi:MAG: hypothetical protein CW716_07575 [Candidatus Bathyarchaeum sp.]|nr:MAG: hypothetical protein CW716_07575 [Candidatus Bathyarchaeum sp.]
MNFTKSRALILALCITALCSLLLAVPLLAPPTPDRQTAIAKAINFLENTDEPYGLLFLDVIYRRFGVEEFADSLSRYDQLLAEQQTQWSIFNVFRRISVYDNPMQASVLDDVLAPTDIIISRALYCDRYGLPHDYFALLDDTANKGEYYLTHVLLACIWIQENGFESSLPNGFVDKVCRATAVLVNRNPLIVDDLTLEAAAFLYIAGQGERVSPSFVNRVLASQNADGGWEQDPDRKEASYWHSTISALLLLLHIEYPADSYHPTIATATP